MQNPNKPESSNVARFQRMNPSSWCSPRHANRPAAPKPTKPTARIRNIAQPPSRKCKIAVSITKLLTLLVQLQKRALARGCDRSEPLSRGHYEPRLLSNDSMHDDPQLLVAALRQGNAEAFQQVYFAEKNRIFGMLLRLSGDAHVAADLFQNVWLKLARHAARLREDTNLRAWLHTVARREYLSYRRAQVVDLSRFLAWGRHVETTARSFAATSETDELEAALEALGERDREVLLLVGVAELTSAQAAEALGISEV